MPRYAYGEGKRAFLRRIGLLVLLLGAALFAAACGSRSAGELPQLGQPMPDFTAIDSDGNRFQLSEAIGDGPLVLVFYRGRFCGTCQAQLRNLEEERERIEQFGAKIIAISTDDRNTARRLKEELGLNFTVLSDSDRKILRQFDHRERFSNLDVHNPAVYILDTNGIIVFRHFGRHVNDRPSVDVIVNQLQALSAQRA